MLIKFSVWWIHIHSLNIAFILVACTAVGFGQCRRRSNAVQQLKVSPPAIRNIPLSQIIYHSHKPTHTHFRSLIAITEFNPPVRMLLFGTQTKTNRPGEQNEFLQLRWSKLSFIFVCSTHGWRNHNAKMWRTGESTQKVFRSQARAAHEQWRWGLAGNEFEVFIDKLRTCFDSTGDTSVFCRSQMCWCDKLSTPFARSATAEWWPIKK